MRPGAAWANRPRAAATWRPRSVPRSLTSVGGAGGRGRNGGERRRERRAHPCPLQQRWRAGSAPRPAPPRARPLPPPHPGGRPRLVRVEGRAGSPSYQGGGGTAGLTPTASTRRRFRTRDAPPRRSPAGRSCSSRPARRWSSLGPAPAVPDGPRAPAGRLRTSAGTLDGCLPSHHGGAASPASDRSALRNAAPAVFKAREHPPPGRISRRPLSATCGPATCGPAMCGSAMCGSATLQQYGCPQAHLRTGPTCGAPARQVNVVGAFIVLKAMGRHMRDNGGGAVVNTASMAAARGTPAMCAYVASKSALVGSVQPPPPETV